MPTPDRIADEPTAEPTLDELRGEQQNEIEHLALGTQGQWHGALAGVAIGAVIGALLSLAVALIALPDVGGALVVVPLIGAAFGAVAGGVYEGGRNPERAGELRTTHGDPDPSSAVESNPPPNTQ